MKKLMLISMMLFMGVGQSLVFSQFASEDAQARLILRIVLYDRNFNRFGDPIKIGCSSKHMAKALNDQSKGTLRGKKVIIEQMDSSADVGKYGIVYIDRNWKKEYEAVCVTAKEKKILMFCGSYQAVEKNQAGLAFRIIQKSIKIVLNLEMVKEMGSEFPSNLLKLSVLVGNLKQ